MTQMRDLLVASLGRMDADKPAPSGTEPLKAAGKAE
jgi:hypothetical protein